MIRPFKEEDIEIIRDIHSRFFENEFDFPDFLKGFICAFTIVDDDDSNKIIACGGVRTLAESILITNKDFNPRIRRKALLEVLDASCYFAGKTGHNSVHAFIQDPEWLHHLKRVGFKDCKGKALYMEVNL